MKRIKGVYYWLIAAGIVIIGLLVAVIVLATRDNELKTNDANIEEYIHFNNGRVYPIVGIGTAYQWDASSDDARQSVMDAIDRGYRHVDTAYIYGTEVGVGEAINAKIGQGVITRSEMFVTSKLWNEFHNPDLVRGALEGSLTRLNLSYVDLYLIHWPMNNPETSDFGLIDTWRALEELVDDGLVMSIGVSNFNSTQLDHILANARILPVNNQIESHPHCLNKQLIAHCHDKNVAVTAYSPLGAPGHPQFNSQSRLAINEPEILAVARRHQRTPAQIMIRYQMQNGNIVIPKTIRRDRVITNFDVFHFTLTDEDIHEIESINYFFRTSAEDNDIGHHQYPFTSFECL